MNRTDRLYAVAEELRRVGRAGTTGPRLARQLEVSERTIKRDISALQQAGLPIWAQAGPGGGYVLDPVASLPPVNFTPSQAVAAAVALAALPAGSPFGADARAAQGKVWDALGPQDRERAQRLAARVWLRPPRTEADDGAPRPAALVLRAIEQSLATERVLVIRYVDGAARATSRRVEPVILAYTEAHWYLVAWCRLRTAIRWFRVDRIERADVTAEQHPPRDVAQAGEPPSSAAPVA
ncbi:MAG: WYL domain-containing protein [Actinomycetales bacterium]|nr:WYL domain-containing protein [Actinomycetales bacterium]